MALNRLFDIVFIVISPRTALDTPPLAETIFVYKMTKYGDLAPDFA
jgi:hypothetical protein